MSGRAPRCPDCADSPAGLRVVFGLPTAETFDAAERGELVLGGCEVLPGPAPRWACPQCQRYLDWGGPSPDIQPAAAGTFRVATWNLRGCPHPDGGKGWEVARWQEKMSADIWLLTEVHRDWAGRAAPGRCRRRGAVTPPTPGAGRASRRSCP